MSQEMNWNHLQVCAVILRAEAGQAPVVDTSWFTQRDGDPAQIYQEAAARWFWTWGKSQGFDIDDRYHRQAAMYDWLAAGMESAQRRIRNNAFASDDGVDNRFLTICESVFDPPNPEWRKGDGMWSWANEYLYDPYPKSQEYLHSNYRYKFGQGQTTWYIVDANTIRMLDFLKGK